VVALDANTAALNRLTGVLGASDVGGGAAGAAGGAGEGAAGGGIAGIISRMWATITGGIAVSGIVGTLNAVVAPLALLAVQIKNDFAPSQAVHDVLSKISDDLTAAGVPASKIPADTTLILQAVNSGKIQTTAQLQAFVKNLAMTAKTSQTTSAAMATMAGMVGKTAPQIDGGFVTLENRLTAMGWSFGKSVAYADLLQATITKYGPLSQVQINTIYNDFVHGATSAFDIALSLKTASENMADLPRSSASIAAGLAQLAKTIPGAKNLPGLGWFAGGGIAEYPASGGLAMLHGTEMVVPKSKASPLLWDLMSNAVAGKSLAFTPAPMPSGGLALSSGRTGAASVAPQYNVQVTVPGGTNLTPQVIANAVAQGLAQHDNELLRTMGMTPRIGAMS